MQFLDASYFRYRAPDGREGGDRRGGEEEGADEEVSGGGASENEYEHESSAHPQILAVVHGREDGVDHGDGLAVGGHHLGLQVGHLLLHVLHRVHHERRGVLGVLLQGGYQELVPACPGIAPSIGAV